MPYHPSLKEILEQDNSYADEWAEFTVKGLGWNVWVAAKRVGEQPEPEYGFACSALSSEFWRFSFTKVIVDFEITSEENLKELKGDPMPLGAFSYYSEDEVIITLQVTSEVYRDVISLVGSGIGELTVRVSVPKWDDVECKCVPITQYQLIFNSKEDEPKVEVKESGLSQDVLIELDSIKGHIDKLYSKSSVPWGWLSGGMLFGLILAKFL